MKNRVCAIIPAINHEETIGDVVRTVLASGLVHEVLVVADGSTDTTASRAREAGAIVYERKRPRGRGQSLLDAVSKTHADILLFLEANMLGLTVDHIERLVLPVLHGARMMNIGTVRGFSSVSSWRAMRRRIFEQVPPEFLHGCLVEVSLNDVCRTNRFSFGVVVLQGLQVPKKNVIQFIRSGYEIAQAFFVIRIAKFLGKYAYGI